MKYRGWHGKNLVPPRGHLFTSSFDPIPQPMSRSLLKFILPPYHTTVRYFHVYYSHSIEKTALLWVFFSPSYVTRLAIIPFFITPIFFSHSVGCCSRILSRSILRDILWWCLGLCYSFSLKFDLICYLVDLLRGTSLVPLYLQIIFDDDS